MGLPGPVTNPDAQVIQRGVVRAFPDTDLHGLTSLLLGNDDRDPRQDRRNKKQDAQ